jgi:hypothetical protein
MNQTINVVNEKLDHVNENNKANNSDDTPNKKIETNNDVNNKVDHVNENDKANNGDDTSNKMNDMINNVNDNSNQVDKTKLQKGKSTTVSLSSSMSLESTNSFENSIRRGSDKTDDDISVFDEKPASEIEDQKGSILDNLEDIEITDVIKYIISNKPSESLPKSVTERSAFVLNMNIHEQRDILADDNGSWRNYAVKHYAYKITNINDPENCNIEFAKDCGDLQDVYQVHKYFYRNKANDEFGRKIVVLESKEKKYQRCFLCYFWIDNSTNIGLPPHGNTKHSDKPYIRTDVSTLKKVFYMKIIKTYTNALN